MTVKRAQHNPKPLLRVPSSSFSASSSDGGTTSGDRCRWPTTFAGWPGGSPRLPVTTRPRPCSAPHSVCGRPATPISFPSMVRNDQLRRDGPRPVRWTLPPHCGRAALFRFVAGPGGWKTPAATGRGGSDCRPKRWPPTTTCGPRSPLPGGSPSPRLAGCRSRPSTNCSTCWLPVSTRPRRRTAAGGPCRSTARWRSSCGRRPITRLFAIETDDGRLGGPDFGVSITLSAGSDGFAYDLVTQPVEATGA